MAGALLDLGIILGLSIYDNDLMLKFFETNTNTRINFGVII